MSMAIEPKGLGGRLKAAREQAEITQIEAAKRLEIDPQSLSRYERGDRTPRSDLLTEMARAYGVGPGELLGNAAGSAGAAQQWADGIMHAAERMSETVTQLIREARGAVRSGPAATTSSMTPEAAVVMAKAALKKPRKKKLA